MKLKKETSSEATKRFCHTIEAEDIRKDQRNRPYLSHKGGPLMVRCRGMVWGQNAESTESYQAHYSNHSTTCQNYNLHLQM